MDLLGIDRDHEDEDEDLAVNVPFHHLQTDTCFAVSFHPDTGENEFEDELEEEMIKIVNPNKHIQNDEDGGR